MGRFYHQRNYGQLLTTLGAIGLVIGALLPWVILRPLSTETIYISGYESAGIITGGFGLFLLLEAMLSKKQPGKLYSVTNVFFTGLLICPLLLLSPVDEGILKDTVPYQVSVGHLLSRISLVPVILGGLLPTPGKREKPGCLGLFDFGSLLRAAIVFISVVILLSLLGRWMLPGEVKVVKAEAAWIKVELPKAKARWQAHNISDYNINIDGGRPFDFVCFSNVTLSVRDGKLASVYNSCCSDCPYDSMTVEQVFTDIEGILENLDPQENYLTAKFDPEWGFVTEYRYGCTKISNDCGEWFKFSNFQPK